MDRKSLVAVIACVLLFVGWEYYLGKKYPDRFSQPAVGPAPERMAGAGGSSGQAGNTRPVVYSPDAGEEAVTALSSEELVLENELVRYRFDQSTGGMQSVALKKFQNDERTGSMEILSAPLQILGATEDRLPDLPPLLAAQRDRDRLMFSYRRGGWKIVQIYSIEQHGYGVGVSVSWENLTDHHNELNSTLIMSENILFQEKSGSFFPMMPTGRPSFITNIAGKTEWTDVQKYCEDEGVDLLDHGMQDLAFVGFDKHYFLQALLPDSKKSSMKIIRSDVKREHSCRLSYSLSLNQGAIAPGARVSMAFKSWFGPKVTEQMEAFDPKLGESLDLGVFSAISRPLLQALKYIQSLVGNWGLTIIIFTILLKMLFYPLTRQATVAQNKMKKMQPQMNKIKERYKEDPKRQQQEIMQFMMTNKVNPMKGCFPILPQIPVFIAFYRVLSTSVELRQAPFFLWITDLSVQDPFYITPLLLGVLMFIQQKLTPSTGMDKSQERIMMMMPLIFSVFMLTLPSGMVLYMLANTLMSIAQQQWLSRKFA